MKQSDIEKQLIGIWVQGKMLQYVELFAPDDFMFYRGTVEKIKKAIDEGKPVSIATASGETTMADLAELMTQAFPSQIETCVEAMQLSIAERKYKEYMKHKPEGNAYEKATEMIERMKLVVPQPKRQDIKSQLLELISDIDKRATAEKPMPYGIPKMDAMTNGIQKENLIIVSGRPGVGKSALALQIANNVLKHKKRVLYVSLEMGSLELIERLVLHISDIDGYNIKRGQLTRYEWDQTSVASDIIADYDLDINSTIRNVGQLRTEIARCQPDLVIVDQLGLLRDMERYNSRREEITAITRKLKLMAMDFQIPIIALAQINRDASESMPTLANLKESGSIEEDANVVIMIHALSRQQCGEFQLPYHEIESGKKTVAIMLAKNRSGETGTIAGVYIGKKYKFMEISK